MRAVSCLVQNNLGISLPFFMECEELFVKYARKHALEDEEFGRWAIFEISRSMSCPNRMELLKRLLSLKIPLKIPFERNKTAMDTSKENGIWDAYEELTMSAMGDSLKNSVLRERDRIEALDAFSSNFFAENKLCFEKGEDDHAMMKQLTISLENAFENRKPISEDLLFLCWKWNTRISGGSPLDSRLGKSLFKMLEDILVIPLNLFDWTWFKANLMPSAVRFPAGALFSFFAFFLYRFGRNL